MTHILAVLAVLALHATCGATSLCEAAAQLPADEIQYRENIVSQGNVLTYDLQCVLQSCCVRYDVPYPLMLAVAETESHFDPDAVSPEGDHGLMQINPINNEWLQALNMDPTTYHGNIEAAVYIMAGYLNDYETIEMAVMAYNSGPSGARRL